MRSVYSRRYCPSTEASWGRRASSKARRPSGRLLSGPQLVATLERAARKDASLRRNLIDEAFKAVQIGNIGTTAAAVARMAARFALDDDELGHLVRQRQDAAERWLFLNTRLIEAAGKPLAKRNHLEERAAREKMAELSAAINALDLELKRQFPEYAELVQPQPAAISEVASWTPSNLPISILNCRRLRA